MAQKKSLEKEKEAHKATKDQLEKVGEELKAVQKQLTAAKESYVIVDKDTETIRFQGVIGEVHPGLIQWLNGSKVTKDMRTERVNQAVKLGLLAQWQGRISAAINSYKSHMDEELALLQAYQKAIEDKFKTDSKFKTDQEITVCNALQGHVSEQNYTDNITVTGTRQEEESSNKTGDVLAVITHNGINHNLAIEVKFATDYPQGGVESKSNVKTTFRTDTDTSTSQLIESRMNRDSRYSIIVLDHTLNLKSKTPEIVFHPDAQGFIVKVNLLDGDFSPLYTAYEVARAMTIASAPINLDYSVLEYLLKDLNTVLKRQGRITNVVKTISNQVIKSHKDNMKTINEQMALYDADLQATKTSIAQTKKALTEFFKTGEFSPTTAFETYVKSKANAEWTVEKTNALEWTADLERRINAELEGAETDGSKTASEEVDTSAEPVPEPIADLEKMTVADLKELCKKQKLPVSGTKDQLIARLKGE